MNTKLKPSIEERTTMAFLDLIIIALLQQKPLTGYAIDRYILEKIKIKLSPEVVYTKLSSMERDGLVSCAQHRRVRIYELTEKGNEIAENRTGVTKEILSFVLSIL